MEIADEPFCIECYTKRDMLVTDGLQRDHVNGFTNEHEFWHGERQTLCKPCNMSKAGKAGRIWLMYVSSGFIGFFFEGLLRSHSL